MCCTIMAVAQGSVSGKVKDKQSNEAFEFVNVIVTKQGDTRLIKGCVTDASGNFRVDGLANGQYTLTLSFVGYKTLSQPFTVNATNQHVRFNTLYLAEDSHILKEVTVVGQQSTMKLEVDRKVYNVAADITSAGASASEVLEKIPSVQVDQDGNVSLRGNESVEVWINGKQSGLTADNRADILQQLPAESIERIEVIDNPSSKFSAEGTAGIINIILKRDRKAGYYGSVQAGATTQGGANASGNVNYSSGILDAYLNLGYRHRNNKLGGSHSEQSNWLSDTYMDYDGKNHDRGNNLFSRAGVTLHATQKDDFTLSGMAMFGGRNNESTTLYKYGTLGAADDSYRMFRRNDGDNDVRMTQAEFNYDHNFSTQHKLNFVVNFFRWKMDADNFYHDSTYYHVPTTFYFQSRPQHINNRSWNIKLDYENQITQNFQLQAGYNGSFSKENTPQESYICDDSWDGEEMVEDRTYFNRFIYKQDTHAFYATATLKFGKLGVMGGLRGEYWKVNTESYSWEQEYDASLRDEPYKKDFFELFPSLFLSYQLTETQQLQLNYTRRLRRPWGGQLNSFRNTRDASMVEFGNPELTPEFTNAFSLNYLKQWDQHSLSVSAYYQPSTDVIQRVKYQDPVTEMMYQTSMNVAKNLRTGLELVAKNSLTKFLDLTTTVNAYYYKLDAFSHVIEGQTVTGDADDSFSWTARMMASVVLPYNTSLQLSGDYRSREVITQGYRRSNYNVDLGVRKTFFDRKLTVAVNARNLLNSRKWRTVTHSDSFERYQKNWRGGCSAMLSVTWNFGNLNQNKRRPEKQGDDENSQDNFGGDE